MVAHVCDFFRGSMHLKLWRWSISWCRYRGLPLSDGCSILGWLFTQSVIKSNAAPVGSPIESSLQISKGAQRNGHSLERMTRF